MLFLNYPSCSTCQKARKWLEHNSIQFIDRNIKSDNPTYEELTLWHSTSGLPLKRFFNTSGLLYKSLSLKDKIDEMTETEKLKLLASDGMLVKRPIVVMENTVLVGFKETDWTKLLLNKND